ncbi:MAG: hypothetical protein CTY39_12150 [Hyphomicrobium sp.]|nr:MAG: hypothetical protein CTY39_12150 [Hyphomicrobium sp.]
MWTPRKHGGHIGATLCAAELESADRLGDDRSTRWVCENASGTGNAGSDACEAVAGLATGSDSERSPPQVHLRCGDLNVMV